VTVLFQHTPPTIPLSPLGDPAAEARNGGATHEPRLRSITYLTIRSTGSLRRTVRAGRDQCRRSSPEGGSAWIPPSGPAPLSGRPPPKSHIVYWKNCYWSGPPPFFGTTDSTPRMKPVSQTPVQTVRIRTAGL